MAEIFLVAPIDVRGEMKAFSAHTGTALPLRRANVDTDQICASRYLKRITKTGYDDALFAAWRSDPEFVMNDPAYSGASVLVVGPSFGTGSSREHAVWALKDYGFRVIIGSSFADIFRGNSGKQGLLLATVRQAEVDTLCSMIEADPGLVVTADLVTQSIDCGGQAFEFEIDAITRHRLLAGLDEIGTTLQRHSDINAIERSRPRWNPRL